MIALSSGGPAIRAKAIWTAERSSKAAAPQLLSNQQRADLSTIGSIVRFKKGQQIYRAGDPIDAIYNVISGGVKSVSAAPGGRKTHQRVPVLKTCSDWHEAGALHPFGRGDNRGDGLPLSRFQAANASPTRPRVGVPCHLQALPGPAVRTVACVHRSNQGRFAQIGDVPAPARRASGEPRRADQRDLSADSANRDRRTSACRFRP